jgi:hypothetical protein
MTVTDPAHVAAADAARRVPDPRTAPSDEDLVRDLADYDRAFGLTR